MFVSDSRSPSETLHAYIQADAGVRATLFSGFMQALKSLKKEKAHEASAWARRAVSPSLDYSSLSSLRRFFVSGEESPAKPLRLAILGGPTTIQLRQLIEVFLAGEGIKAEIYESDYGLFRHEILTPGSGLDNFQPELVFIATGARDAAHCPAPDMDERAVSLLAAKEIAGWNHLWETCQTRWKATVIQNNFEIMPWGVWGHYAARHPAARENYLDRLNRALVEAAPPHVILHDLRHLAAEAGARDWFDPRFIWSSRCLAAPGAS